jgi:hypothetical protein
MLSEGAVDAKVRDMPDFKGIENFQLILLFVVPGLIALFVRSRFIAGRAPSVTENLLIFIVLSLFYYSFTIFFVKPVIALQGPGYFRLSPGYHSFS